MQCFLPTLCTYTVIPYIMTAQYVGVFCQHGSLTLSAGVEWLQAQMGPREVWRHQETSDTIQTHLASWHSALQQVRVCMSSSWRERQLVNVWFSRSGFIIWLINQRNEKKHSLCGGVTVSGGFSHLYHQGIRTSYAKINMFFFRDFEIKMFCILFLPSLFFCFAEVKGINIC